MSRPLWDNKEFVKLDRRKDRLYGKVKKFVVEKDKKKVPKGATFGQYGSWKPRKSASVKDKKDYIKVSRQLKRKFDY